jgi:hypothetical protein
MKGKQRRKPRARQYGPNWAAEWWIRQAGVLAQKMKQGGVKSIEITLTERGTYAFEITPELESFTRCSLAKRWPICRAASGCRSEI